MAEQKVGAAPLPEHFRAEDGGSVWRLFCRKCGKGWELKKTSNHPGNLLHLLNHAASHRKGEGSNA